jgi:hypothetical protein
VSGIRQPGRDAKHSPSYKSELRNQWIYNSLLLYALSVA